MTSVSDTHELGHVDLPDSIHVVALAGDIAHALGDGGSLSAIDIAQAQAPRVLASLQLPYDDRLGGAQEYGDIAVAGPLVAVATSQGTGVLLVHFTQPQPPTPTATPGRGDERVYLPIIELVKR